MQTHQQGDNLCVELDVAGIFSDYVEPITVEKAVAIPDSNIADILLLQSSYNLLQQQTSGLSYSDYFLAGDQLSLVVDSKLSPFFVPQPIGFNGICSNFVGTRFMNEVEESECSQYISNAQLAAQTFLNSASYVADTVVLAAGVSKTSSPITIE